MSKMYTKDEKGKYHLVDKPEPNVDVKEPNVNVNKPQAKGEAFVREVMEGPKIAELEKRISVLEKILLGDRAK